MHFGRAALRGELDVGLRLAPEAGVASPTEDLAAWVGGLLRQHRSIWVGGLSVDREGDARGELLVRVRVRVGVRVRVRVRVGFGMGLGLARRLGRETYLRSGSGLGLGSG